MSYQIHFERENRTVTAEEGELLSEVIRRSGFMLDEPCGGQGRCGKCIVGFNGRRVLACRERIFEDARVELQEYAGDHLKILTDSDIPGEGAFSFCPAVTQHRVMVEKCPFGKSTSDWERLIEGVHRSGVPCSSRVNLEAASAVGEICKKTGGEVFVVLADREILAVSAGQCPVYMAAFDIGTTTVAGFLLNASDGSVCAKASCMNPQIQFGGDVISRANRALEHGGKELADCIRGALDSMLGELADKAGAVREQIYAVSVAGNTCMHHLFLGISVDSLVHAPYAPAVSQPMILNASAADLHIHPCGKLMMLPNIAGFVGADTVACLAATDLAEQEEWTLLVDIGTNGEMVLGKNHRMAACSTAAGPAFEGTGISCGMRGADGAVSKVKWNGSGWDYETIGGGKARGICGSGLLDLAAELLASGQMDDSGELENPEGVVVVPAEEAANEKPVCFSQRDVRQLQLAKSAIASGVRLLAKKMGIAVADIAKVWLAGAFGNFLSPESACRIGLIPAELKGKVTAVGNAAGEGAKLVLINREKWEEAEALARETDFLELASMPEFQDMFVDELLFPEAE